MTGPRPTAWPRWPAASGTLVVDTWDGAPRAVRDAARALHGSVGCYGYVSSGSVYAPPFSLGAAEDAARGGRRAGRHRTASTRS